MRVEDAVDTALVHCQNWYFELDQIRLQDGLARNEPAVVGECNNRWFPDRFDLADSDYFDTVPAIVVVHSRIIYL